MERTGSTNADLLAAAAAGAPDRTVLVAEHQEAGRGRLARSWVSPPGSGLTVSVLVRPDGRLRVAAGLADRCWRASPRTTPCASLADVPCGLKWPNDLLLGPGQRKVAGILAEVPTARSAVVIGIGLNVAAAPADQPGATSLAAEGVDVGQTEVLIALLTALRRRESAWRAGRGDPDATRVRADYRAACLSLGAGCGWSCPAGRSTPASPRTSTPTAGCSCSTPRATAGRSRQAMSCTCARPKLDGWPIRTSCSFPAKRSSCTSTRTGR